ncbi:hypothetical protein DP939_34250 [Spongiactinospora rosea]|uniref:Carbohydrate kinase PfkB domain-containing protein n=1 Tax=Spongiactinospora rosea TaxID=2248750 RepID=A0A366LP59_9ACTN|nr:PfkB family carbohydrate kinase [Spongiactinospora rosea]RBQ15745.1 hypothetical protein DP939_34250 [Spongiactinospora rosea]
MVAGLRRLTACEVVIGTGGIGSGVVFALDSDHAIRREESRAADLLDSRDYGKLHIVCHYLRTLLRPDLPVVPVGAVGADERGSALLAELRAVGLDATHVRIDASRPTLFAACFVYPSGEGGNLTARNSASASVGLADIRGVSPLFRRHRGKGVALALPEVPLPARSALLDLATEHGFFRVTSFVSGEAGEAEALLPRTDLLAVNIDEARALVRSRHSDPAAIVTAAIDRHPGLNMVITAGTSGSWAWDTGRLTHSPARPARVASTAGAGDAYLAGVLAALVQGRTLADAARYGAVVAMLKVTCPHTINPDITAETVTTALDRLRC